MGEITAGQRWQEHVTLCSEMESDVLRERTLAHFSASSLLLMASQSCDHNSKLPSVVITLTVFVLSLPTCEELEVSLIGLTTWGPDILVQCTFE